MTRNARECYSLGTTRRGGLCVGEVSISCHDKGVLANLSTYWCWVKTRGNTAQHNTFILLYLPPVLSH